MTSVDLRTNSACSNAPVTTDERRKSVLFCPVCGHESPVDDEWDVTVVGDDERVICPVCDEVVASR